MSIISFIVEGKPQPKLRARKGKHGKWYTPSKTKKYEERILWEFKNVALEFTDDYEPEAEIIKVSVTAYFEPPKSWSEKKRAESIGKPHKVRPDIDNIVKTVLDALNKIAWGDDSSVQLGECKKLYSWFPALVVSIEYDEELPTNEAKLPIEEQKD